MEMYLVSEYSNATEFYDSGHNLVKGMANVTPDLTKFCNSLFSIRH